MLGRGKVGEGRVTVPMSDAVGKFFPEVGEQWIELSVALSGDGQEMRGSRFGYSNSGGSKYMGSLLGFRRAVNSRREVGSRDYSSSIVANSRSSLYLRNMVELVVDFTSSGILKQSK